MADEKLTEYERKRSFEKTPEPRGGKTAKRAEGSRFVVQEHHARRLHWDLRLEHDGVAGLLGAAERGCRQDPKENRLAVHTEDHPLEYLEFEGEIPKGEYGAGTMRDLGPRHLRGREVPRRRGDPHLRRRARRRASTRLFQTKGNNWMIHRMDPPADPDREPMPEQRQADARHPARPACPATRSWAYEIKWDGVRAIAYSEAGTCGSRAATCARSPRTTRSCAPWPPSSASRGGPRRRGRRLRRRGPARASSSSRAG